MPRLARNYDPEEYGLKPRYKLKYWMMKRGLSGRALAAACEKSGYFISPSIISGLITGRMNPFMEERQVISKVLRKNMRELELF